MSGSVFNHKRPNAIHAIEDTIKTFDSLFIFADVEVALLEVQNLEVFDVLKKTRVPST